MEAQEGVGAWGIVGCLMSRARKGKRKHISERGNSKARLRGNFTEHMVGPLSFPQAETSYISGESTLIHSFERLKLFCSAGFYDLSFISSVMP